MKIITAIFTCFLLLGCLAGEFGKAHRLPRTILFTQGQMKYTLNPNFTGQTYFSHWIDWPLRIDSELKEANVRYRGLQYPDYVKIQETIQQYGLDGLGFWEQHSRFGWVSDLIGFTGRSRKADFVLIPFLSALTDTAKDLPRIVASKQIMTIDGKKVLWGYNWRTDAEFAARRQNVEAAYPGKFLYIMNKTVPASIREKFARERTLSHGDCELLKREVRNSLRRFDGFGWWDFCTMTRLLNHRRVFDAEFGDRLLALTAEVFAEPEFKDKLFVSEALVGHENPSSVGYIQSSEGTKALRDSLLPALKYGVDIVNIPEWDEQNENTSLRPTVCNGTSHWRLLRYISGKLKGETDFRLPGDNPAVPNMIISMRKIVSLGEKLEFELLNVPDSANDNTIYTVQLSLHGIDGRALHVFPEITVNAGALQEFRPAVASEKFATERVLLPRLTVCRDNVRTIYGEGLSAVQLQSTWNFDYKWLKQPLRDLMAKPQIAFSLTPAPAEYAMRVKAEIVSPEVLSFAELLDNGDCVYSATGGEIWPWRENDETLACRIGMQSLVPQKASGTITLEGTAPRWKSGRTGNAIVCRNDSFDLWHRGDWVSFPRRDLHKAVFKIDFPGHFSGRIPFTEIMRRGSFIAGGNKGLNIALTRQLRQYFHPRNLNKKSVFFNTIFAPDTGVSVIQLQLISADGRLWRTAPRLTAPATMEKVNVTVFSEMENRPVSVAVPANFVPDLRYEWGAERGLIAANGYGRTLWGIRGGYTDLASLRNCGGDQSGDGTPPGWRLAQKFWQEAGNLAPALEEQPDGGVALRFTGGGEHVAFPTGTIPRRAGFVIEFAIKPENGNPLQYLLSNRRAYPGALRHLTLEKCTLRGEYVNDRLQIFRFDSALSLKNNEWNKVKITFDLTAFEFEVNGVKSRRFAAPGPGLYDTGTLLGTWENMPFRGLIRDFRIRHFL